MHDKVKGQIQKRSLSSEELREENSVSRLTKNSFRVCLSLQLLVNSDCNQTINSLWNIICRSTYKRRTGEIQLVAELCWYDQWSATPNKGCFCRQVCNSKRPLLIIKIILLAASWSWQFPGLCLAPFCHFILVNPLSFFYPDLLWSSFPQRKSWHFRVFRVQVWVTQNVSPFSSVRQRNATWNYVTQGCFDSHCLFSSDLKRKKKTLKRYLSENEGNYKFLITFGAVLSPQCLFDCFSRAESHRSGPTKLKATRKQDSRKWQKPGEAASAIVCAQFWSCSSVQISLRPSASRNPNSKPR